MSKPNDDDLVRNFERRESHHIRVTILLMGGGLVLAVALGSLALMGSRRAQSSQAQVDTLVSRVAVTTQRNDSLAQVLRLRDSSMTMTNTGALLATQGRIDDAHRLYRAAIAVDSANWSAWELEGTLYRRTQPARAVPALRRSIALNPSNPWAYYNLAIALWRLGHHDAAIDTLERVVELAPSMRSTLREDAQFGPFHASDRFQRLVQP